MGSLADGTIAVWSMPQFWEFLPVTAFVLLFGSVVSIAVMRARREDIPGIFDTLNAFFGAIFARREYQPPVRARRVQGEVMENARPIAVVHHAEKAQQEEEVQG